MLLTKNETDVGTSNPGETSPNHLERYLQDDWSIHLSITALLPRSDALDAVHTRKWLHIFTALVSEQLFSCRDSIYRLYI